MASVPGEIDRGTWTMSRINNLADRTIKCRTGARKWESPVKCPLCLIVISKAANLKRHMIKLHVNERIKELVSTKLDFDPPEFEDPLPASSNTINGDSQGESSNQYEAGSSNDESTTGSLWSNRSGSSSSRSNNRSKKRLIRTRGTNYKSNTPSPVPTRDKPRRLTKAVTRFGHTDSDPDDPDEQDSDGADFQDSDDDPDFILGKKGPEVEDDTVLEFSAKRFRGSRGRDVRLKVEGNVGSGRGNVSGRSNSPVIADHSNSIRGSKALKRKIDAISKDCLPQTKVSTNSTRPIGRVTIVNLQKSEGVVSSVKECCTTEDASVSEVSCRSEPQGNQPVITARCVEDINGSDITVTEEDQDIPELTPVQSEISNSAPKRQGNQPVMTARCVEDINGSDNTVTEEDQDIPELTPVQSEISNSAPKRRGRPPTYFKSEQLSIKDENGDIIDDPESVPPTPSSPSSPGTMELTAPGSSTSSPTSISPTPPLVPVPYPSTSPPPPSATAPPTPTAPTTPTASSSALVFPDETERKTNSKLSSAYNYALQRSNRQNSTIRLPEGPQLTPEQLQIVESQFKSGDFVMAKKDADMMDNPPIWRIDGKSLLQKFQAFDKDGKFFYRNISTYSGWTPQAKALYIAVRTKFVFQSRYDTVVEMLGIKTGSDEEEEPDKNIEPEVTAMPTAELWTPPRTTQEIEISEELRSHMPSFEIYLQALISQALDNNFLKEIYEEYDEYFVDRMKAIEDLSDKRQIKLMEIVKWDPTFKSSLNTWPCINVMITKNAEKCSACEEVPATKLCQLYGQPYHQQNLRSREPNTTETETKNFEICERCSTICQLYNKACHQKYDYYSQCKSTVTNMRVTHPSKHTTTILRDLLANDHWIMGLFRSMCTTWIKVDRLHQAELDRIKDFKT